MFNLFKKKQKQLPRFEILQSSEYRDKYFVRVAQWDWLDKEHITVTDPVGPRLFTLDARPQLVFIAANGQMTVTEYIHFMAGKYSGEAPGILGQRVINQIETLLGYRIIELRDTKSRPEPQYELPYLQKAYG